MEDVFSRLTDKFNFRPGPLFIGHELPQAFNRIGVGNFIGTGSFHVDAQVIEDRIDGKDFFFRNARHVIVERAAIDDILGGLFDVRRFVDDDRRIARAGTDGFLARRKDFLDDARAARCDDQAYFGITDHFVGSFDGRFPDHGNQIERGPGFIQGLVQELYQENRRLLGPRMRAEDDGVTAGNHADRVIDNRFCRIRRRRNGPDDTERAVFKQDQAVFPRTGVGLQIFNARRIAGSGCILDDFIFVAADFRFFDGHARHHLHVVLIQAGLPDDVDPLLPLRRRLEEQRMLSRSRRIDGIGHGRKDTVLIACCRNSRCCCLDSFFL